MKRLLVHLMRWERGVAIVSMWLGAQLYGNDDPSLKDPAWIMKENQRIHDQYRNEPDRLSAELDKFNKRVSRALGTEKLFERRAELIRKYGPVSEVTQTLPVDESAIMIDHDAWRFSSKLVDNRLTVTFFLDKSRYRDAKPVDLRAQLRRRGSMDDSFVARWQDSNESFAIDLPYRINPNGTFQVSVVLPERERAQYVIQVFANIEPGWAVESQFNLE